MRERWRRRVALSGAVVVAGIFLTVSTLGCVGFSECTWANLPILPGTETQLTAGVFAVLAGMSCLAWAIRGYRRSGVAGK
jgi:hypothetical protein